VTVTRNAYKSVLMTENVLDISKTKYTGKTWPWLPPDFWPVRWRRPGVIHCVTLS